VKHSNNQQPRRGRGPARRVGRTLALVLPVMMVLSGTLAVTRVNWSGSPSSSMLTATDVTAAGASSRAAARAPQDILRDQLMTELQDKNPGVVLTHLQEAVNGHPSLATPLHLHRPRTGPRRGPYLRRRPRPVLRPPRVRHRVRLRGHGRAQLTGAGARE
jgi:hypothetical protein